MNQDIVFTEASAERSVGQRNVMADTNGKRKVFVTETPTGLVGAGGVGMSSVTPVWFRTTEPEPPIAPSVVSPPINTPAPTRTETARALYERYIAETERDITDDWDDDGNDKFHDALGSGEPSDVPRLEYRNDGGLRMEEVD